MKVKVGSKKIFANYTHNKLCIEYVVVNIFNKANNKRGL